MQHYEHKQGLRLLILEDVPTDAELMEAELRSAGFDFLSAWVDNQDSFLEALDHFSPEIILADYMLPAFDGESALAIARGKAPGVPFIFVTGALGEERAVDLLKRGATDFVLKDHLDRIPVCVRRALEEIEEKQRRQQAEDELQRAHAELEREVEKRTKELRQRTLELQQLTDTLEWRVRERTEELAKANEALRDLSARLLSAQEEERKRVAGNLHDTIGSSLVAIKFKVEKAVRELEATPRAAGLSLNTIVPLIQESIEECRRIQQDLRPASIDFLGLLPTLSWFCRRFQSIYSTIRVEQEISIEEAEIPDDLKIVLFRITQEALNNIAKYSQAALVRLVLRKMNTGMELVIEDNGCGFDLTQMRDPENAGQGLGLTSMRERTELSGGSFVIESEEGKGTVIRGGWPL